MKNVFIEQEKLITTNPLNLNLLNLKTFTILFTDVLINLHH